MVPGDSVPGAFVITWWLRCRGVACGFVAWGLATWGFTAAPGGWPAGPTAPLSLCASCHLLPPPPMLLSSLCLLDPLAPLPTIHTHPLIIYLQVDRVPARPVATSALPVAGPECGEPDPAHGVLHPAAGTFARGAGTHPLFPVSGIDLSHMRTDWVFCGVLLNA